MRAQVHASAGTGPGGRPESAEEGSIFIRHDESGLVLFAGRVADPTKA